jgi:hypothetical protein
LTRIKVCLLPNTVLLRLWHSLSNAISAGARKIWDRKQTPEQSMSAAVPDWQAARAQAEAEAAARLDSDPALAAAVPQIAVVLGQLLTDDPAAKETSLLQKLGTEIAARLHTAEYADWADAFEQRFVSADASFTSRLIAVELAIGAAAGDLFGRNPGDLELTLVRHILEALPAAFRTFDVAAEAALRQTPGGAELLDAVLRQRAANFATAPHETPLTYPPLPTIPPELNRTGRRLIDAWEGSPGSRPVFVPDAFAYDLLRRVDRQAYLAAVQTLPHPGLAQHVIATAGRHASLGELCLLLREAGPAFDPDGIWIEESTVPFLLLALCTERLSGSAGARHGRPDTCAPSTDAAAGDMMPEILDALAARPDGVPLGYAWLQYLIWSGHARGRWRKGLTTSSPPDLLTVLKLLGAWLPPHSEPEKWIAEEQELWRNDRIFSILIILLSHAAERGTAADFVARVLTQDLASSFGVERFAADAGSYERHIIGSAIGAIPDAANWFKQLWATLFHLRDRARRYRHGRGSQTPPNVGQVAVIWSLCGLGFIDPASEGSRALWVQLEAAARESILTDGVRLHNDAWRAALCWLGAYWPVIFRDDPPAGSPGSLDDFISFWAAPASEFAILIHELHHQGVTITQLSRSLPDGQLLRHGADKLGRMRGVDPGSKIASAIRKIADNLDALRIAEATAATRP